ncbi:hypothetical protein [Bosea sp. LjRoot237]|uniref:hypothetical protein n=1 Tax=Bosea sp. LjRoot237 TaxID=3342292 RepID=UPI003ECD3C54
MSFAVDYFGALFATSKASDNLARWLLRYYTHGPAELDSWIKWSNLMDASQTEAASVWVGAYSPQLNYPNAWLSAVEARIRDSILPDGHSEEYLGEWLSPDAARAALAFFEAGADMLPSEPHIYGTSDGDLVAEFEGPEGRITSIVSRDETTLFGVSEHKPDRPIQTVIPRGSNQYREHLRSFTKKMAARQHGEVVAGH